MRYCTAGGRSRATAGVFADDLSETSMLSHLACWCMMPRNCFAQAAPCRNVRHLGAAMGPEDTSSCFAPGLFAAASALVVATQVGLGSPTLHVLLGPLTVQPRSSEHCGVPPRL